MLNVLNVTSEQTRRAGHRWTLREALPPQWTLVDLVTIIRRRFRFVMLAAALALAAVSLYLAMTPARYTATAALIPDTKRTPPSPTEVAQDALIDPAIVENQVETIRSETIAGQVVDKLGLWRDPEFVGDGPGLVSRILAASGLTTIKTPSDTIKKRAAVASFLQMLAVKRVGHSFVTSIAFTSLDPEKAATIANAVAAAYVDDQLGQRFANAERTSVWMRQRIETLGREAEAAAAAVAAYKERNRIVLGPEGRTDDELQLAERKRDLDAATADVADAKARLERTQQLRAAEGDGSTFPEASLLTAVDSPAIREIVRQHQNLVASAPGTVADEASSTEPNRALAAASLRSRLWDEVRRAEAADRASVESATLRLASLSSRTAELNAKVEETRASVAELRRLEANHARVSQLHDLLQNRFSRVSDFMQQQYLPVTESRIVTNAMPPLNKSSPKSALLLFLGAVAGTLVGMGGALAKEYTDHSITRPDQLEQGLGMRWIGTLTRFGTGRDGAVPPAADLSEDGAPRRDGDATSGGRDPAIGRAADTLKGIKVALDDSVSATTGGHLVAVASAEAGTGKTTVALGLAVVTAAAGHRTLLIDGNVRNASLSIEAAQSRRPSPVAVTDDTPFFERPVEHPLGFHVLPQRIDDFGPDLLAMREVRHLLQRLRKSYDYVIVDTAAMLDHIDLAAAAGIFDAIVIVVEHGRTVSNDLELALGRSVVVGERIAGAVINKAPPPARWGWL
ncbi:hypothetical protein CCR97_11415 [Rhodoplanes elegans]|uniref:Polysaccharide chain length determinant N-terminal domain-containing protein n=1 Tax=Rhodoplanes elegans TaxID=29408 RepID=A0A327KNG7_9BRAD|nr:Wzz/FepE/Etk N-terminal domain-containing protein [Rhodoplanes elegans]MBK5958814.1 hypothetical protein [Rhodoplanes elegans]RAI38852.1 hypothetical protein CH338_11320 [Rhodoplanes elegans]